MAQPSPNGEGEQLWQQSAALALVLARVLEWLPPEGRAGAALVCHAWRAVVSDPSSWEVLDNVVGSDAVLCGAVQNSQGRLRRLHVVTGFTVPTLLSLAPAFTSLTTLTVSCRLFLRDVSTLAAAAPSLASFTASGTGNAAECCAALAGVAPFAPLRLAQLTLEGDTEAGVLALALSLASARWPPKALELVNTPVGAAMAPLLAAVAAQRLTLLRLVDCSLPPDAAAQLGLLARSHALQTLDVLGTGLSGGGPLCRAPTDGAALGAALRASRLSTLRLDDVRLFGAEHAAGLALLGSLVGHPTLTSLDVSHNPAAPHGRRLGEALSALLGVPSRLRTLRAKGARLGPSGLGALLPGLRASSVTHLDLRGNGLTRASLPRLRSALLAAPRLRRVQLAPAAGDLPESGSDSSGSDSDSEAVRARARILSTQMHIVEQTVLQKFQHRRALAAAPAAEPEPTATVAPRAALEAERSEGEAEVG